MISSFFRTRKAKKFNYTPRYYDPRKEALDDLVERAKAEREGKLPTRHQLRFERKYGVHAARKASNIRLIIIIVLLALVVFIMLS